MKTFTKITVIWCAGFFIYSVYCLAVGCGPAWFDAICAIVLLALLLINLTVLKRAY